MYVVNIDLWSYYPKILSSVKLADPIILTASIKYLFICAQYHALLAHLVASILRAFFEILSTDTVKSQFPNHTNEHFYNFFILLKNNVHRLSVSNVETTRRKDVKITITQLHTSEANK